MNSTDAEIQEFYNFLQIKPLSTAQIALWQALHYIYTKCKKEWFSVANQTLELLTGSSRQSIYENRNILKQNGLIDFKSNGTKATTYTMLNILQDTLQTPLQNTLQSTLQVTCTLYKLNYIKLLKLFNYINKKEQDFENLTERDRNSIIATLERLKLYTGDLSFDEEEKKEFVIKYWCIKELYLSSFKVYLNDIDEQFFKNKYLKTQEMLNIETIDIETDLDDIVSYFIKTLKREYEVKK